MVNTCLTGFVNKKEAGISLEIPLINFIFDLLPFTVHLYYLIAATGRNAVCLRAKTVK